MYSSVPPSGAAPRYLNSSTDIAGTTSIAVRKTAGRNRISDHCSKRTPEYRSTLSWQRPPGRNLSETPLIDRETPAASTLHFSSGSFCHLHSPRWQKRSLALSGMDAEKENRPSEHHLKVAPGMAGKLEREQIAWNSPKSSTTRHPPGDHKDFADDYRGWLPQYARIFYRRMLSVITLIESCNVCPVTGSEIA
jgi:hypothetical protein